MPVGNPYCVLLFYEVARQLFAIFLPCKDVFDGTDVRKPLLQYCKEANAMCVRVRFGKPCPNATHSSVLRNAIASSLCDLSTQA